MTTEAQIQSNQTNALKSTGPVTDQGKQIVKMNPLKHGILSKEVCITVGDGKEDESELATLTERLVQEWQPTGLLEEMYLDQIITAYWRLRRVVWSENGEIRKEQDHLILDRILKRLDQSKLYEKFPEMSQSQRMQSSFGIESLIQLIESVEEELTTDNSLSEETEESLMKNFNPEDNSFGITVAVMNRIIKGEDIDDSGNQEKSPVSPEQAKDALLKLMAKEKGRLKECADMFREKESLGDESALLAASLPGKEVLDKIIRYEAHLQRSISRSVHELERLQAVRRGEHVPLPVAIDVNLGNNN